MIRKKLLLVCPIRFYYYSDFLKISFQKLGYDVRLANEEFPYGHFYSALAKLFSAVNLNFLSITTKAYFSKHLLSGNHYDLIIIIKGRGISKKLIKLMKKHSNRIIGYNFDSFDFNKNSLRWFKHVDNFYTFDFRDSKNYKIPMIHLFSSIKTKKNIIDKNYDISVIQKIHSNRLNFIHFVINAMKDKSIFIYLYEVNLFSFLKNFLMNPFLYFKLRKYIHFEPLSYDKYVKLINESRFTLDIAHPKQSGITIRCFEALHLGTKIITNNNHIFQHNFFDNNNTVLIKNKNIKKFISSFKFTSLTKSFSIERNIDDFINELIS